MNLKRRQFIAAACAAGVVTARSRRASGFQNANDRPRIGVVGCGSRWDQRATMKEGRYGVGKEFPKFGDIVAVCDVDADRADRGRDLVKEWLGSAPDSGGDYRKIIDRDDVDVVHISTPDHWHAKVAIEAMLSGKDVYCEKPMTLTIEEGRQLCEVYRKTGRIVQIGTQQRSMRQMLQAIALIRAGRLGELKRVQCAIGGGPTSPEIPTTDPPKHLDWDRWCGPAPLADYRSLAGAKNETKSWSRCHYEFRWWYEYSGGKLTDWGAHHVDIATWGMGKIETGPVTVDPVMVKHPVEFQDGMPVQKDRYNTATAFNIQAKFADGLELTLRHDTSNGILFEGTEGRIFVNRGRLTGKPVEELQSNPLPEGAIEEVYGRPLSGHVENFFRSVADRKPAISEPCSHHRALTTCHLAGIAARLGRKLQWDPVKQQVTGDPQAQSLVAREQRAGYEIEV
ncbi:MAG: Gfo/Idh/MocA family oxidoreductase [Planctomycetota bacterium]